METRKLKVDLHLHTGEDPLDSIKYNAEQLIDNAHKMGFDVISITNHHIVTYNEQLAEYAGDKGILLIPGIELSIDNKHILIINGDKSCSRIKTFEDLRRQKDKDSLIIAPHPFFPGYASLNSKLCEHFDIFNGIEYSYFHSRGINFNKKAIRKAREYSLPLIGTSDTHRLWQLGRTFSIIEADKSVESVINAIKRHQVEVVTAPLGLGHMLKIGLRLLSDLNCNAIKSFFPSFVSDLRKQMHIPEAIHIRRNRFH